MFGLLDSLVDVAKDITKIATAPVEIALDVTKAVTKPVADLSEELTKDIKSILK